MLDAFPHIERPVECPLRERGLMIGEIGLAPNLRCICLTPCILAIRVCREIERFASRLNGLRWIGPSQSDSRHRNKELDAEQPVPARDGVQMPRLSLAKGRL
jgi:hypothetical protein